MKLSLKKVGRALASVLRDVKEAAGVVTDVVDTVTAIGQIVGVIPPKKDEPAKAD